MSDKANKKNRDQCPPPPLFLNQKERDLVKQVNDELIERVIGQRIAYYPINLEKTNFHPLYGESFNKVFSRPLFVHALIEWEEPQVTAMSKGIDRTYSITIHFHKRRLTEDQNLYVKEGDFVCYGTDFYEIVSAIEPRELWGQTPYKVEISAKCIKARRGTFTIEQQED